jgi:hypothetical protein
VELFPAWALITVSVLFTFFPLSLAYTVIVQRALDLRIILRQGTRYAFARGTLWVLQAIVFAFLGFRIYRFAYASGRIAHLIASIILVVVVLFLRLRIARPLSLWIDRRFFREAYSADRSCLSFLSKPAASLKPSLCCARLWTASARRCTLSKFPFCSARTTALLCRMRKALRSPSKFPWRKTPLLSAL